MIRRFGFVLYDGMTVMDFLGTYDALYRIQQHKLLPPQDAITLTTCGFAADTTITAQGLRLGIDTPNAPPLSQYDAVVIPGGLATRDLVANTPFINWIKTCHEVTTPSSPQLTLLRSVS